MAAVEDNSSQFKQIYRLAAVMLFIQGLLGWCIVYFFISIQLELLYPYITALSIRIFEGFLLLHWGIAFWSMINSLQKVRFSPKNEKIFRIILLFIFPIGTILGWYLILAHRSFNEIDPSVAEKIINERTLLAMQWILGICELIIGIAFVALALFIHEKIVDLIYPLYQLKWKSIFLIIGLALVGISLIDCIMSLLIGIARKLKFNGIKMPVLQSNSLIGKAWYTIHVIILPFGPILALFYYSINKSK
jgi:hypothetical protein